MSTTVEASAPGRVCLFGEHQDYLGLPVIAAAVNLRIGIEGRHASGRTSIVRMPDTEDVLEIDLNAEHSYGHRRDYLRSGANVLRRRGLSWPSAWDVTMRGEIPINAGVSSSSAMVVMWAKFLVASAASDLVVSDEDLARLGYQIEVTEFGEPGGMMDHYCAALGGALRIDTRPPFVAERLPVHLGGFVLGNSLEPKATVETLRSRRADVVVGLDLIRERMVTFSLGATSLLDAEEYLPGLPDRPARRLRANLINRDITTMAGGVLAVGDERRLGELLCAHHAQLRDGLDLSTPRIERMLDASLAAGALGGKVNGSGGGGCMFAYAPGREQEVAEAIRSAGGVPYIVHVDRGASCTIA